MTSRQNTALFHTIFQRLIININQLFNIRQQEYYLVTDELKCDNLCSKYPPFSLTQVWIRQLNIVGDSCESDSHESPTTFSCCNIISHQCWSNL